MSSGSAAPRISGAVRSAGSPARSDGGDVAAAVDAIRRILRALRVAARLTEAAAGLSAAQLFVLSVAADAEESSMSQLAERTMTDRSSVAAVVDRLAERGLVLRRQSARDRRRAAISITAAGRRALRAAPQAPTELLVSGLRALAPDELRDLAVGLEALTRTLGIGGGPAGMLFEEDATPAAPGVVRSAKPARPK